MAKLTTIYATSYQKVFDSGRTMPCVFLCEDHDGHSVGEFVVKLRSQVGAGNSGLLRELVGSLLATDFGLAVPEAALVLIDAELSRTIPDPKIAKAVRDSGGLNFGTKNLVGGYVTFPIHQGVPAHMRPMALQIYAFDAFIENPDRRAEKPNLLWKGDEFYLIDHELAFSFLNAVAQSPKPWIIHHLPFLAQHVFYHDLKGQALDFAGAKGAIDRLSDVLLDDMGEIIPNDWKNSTFDGIRANLVTKRDKSADFIAEIRRVLI